MPYPGGKNGSGVYQRIINLMPPHEVYIEPFLGGAAIMRLKRPAALNIGVDRLDLRRSHIARSGDVGRRRPVSPQPAVLEEPPAASPALAMVDPTSPKTARAAAIATSGDASRFKIVKGCGIDFLERYPFTGREVVYCDPPYLASTRSSRRRYKFELADVDHRRLLRCIRTIPAPVLISGYESQMYLAALKGWNLIRYDAVTRGGMTEECLWFNFPEPVELHDYRYLGQTFRERERIKRKKLRWVTRFARMPLLEKRALLSAIADIAISGERIRRRGPR